MTVAASSKLAYFAFKKQSAHGTPGVPDQFFRWLDGASCRPDPKHGEFAEGDGSFDISLIVKQSQIWKIKLVGYLRPGEAGYILDGISGAGADALTGAADPYTHTLTPQDAPAWYTVEYAMTDPNIAPGSSVIVRAADVIFTQVDVEGDPGMPVKFTAEMVGRTATRQTALLTPTYEAGYPYLYHNAVLKRDDVDVSSTITKFKLSYQHGIDDSVQTVHVTPETLAWTSRKVTLDLETIFQSNADYNLMFFGNETGTTDSYKVADGLTTDFLFYPKGDTTDAHTLQLKLNNLVLEGDPFDPKTDGKAIRQPLKGVAMLPASGNLIDIIAINATATAY